MKKFGLCACMTEREYIEGRLLYGRSVVQLRVTRAAGSSGQHGYERCSRETLIFSFVNLIIGTKVQR
jgi:hypothetical protein